MRLINVHTFEVKEFSLGKPPPYATLSHTWSDDEVTFQDMAAPSARPTIAKKGYAKIEQTCLLAQKAGFDFVWIDTCCIDKLSSAELTESINSMFQWYKNAALCYVFLEDLVATAEDALSACRWFTRGWTLQELLAPKNMEFYDSAWNYRGTKLSFIHTISNLTRIPRQILVGDAALAEYSVASRMSWAAHRQTTRIEDMAYSLLGIFGVNMPLIYGEGLDSYRRLQEEIVRRNNDLTIFAWQNSVSDQGPIGLFASSPAAFAGSGGIRALLDDNMDFSVTNKGLRVSGDAPLAIAAVTKADGSKVIRYAIFLGHSSSMHGIYLRKLGPKLFYRDGSFPLAGFGAEVDQVEIVEAMDYYIIIDPKPAIANTTTIFRRSALHIPFNNDFTLQAAVPRALWDASDRLFLRPSLYGATGYPMVIAMAFDGIILGQNVGLVVFCDYRSTSDVPICKVFRRGWYQRQGRAQEATLFEGKNRNDSVYWADLEFDGLDDIGNVVNIQIGMSTARITVSFRSITVGASNRYPVWTLGFSIFEFDGEIED